MSTFLDVLGATGCGEVDERGGLTAARAGWKLDWWVRSAERWHKASTEAGVRQVQHETGAVVETRMRVLNGDAAHRVWAVAAGGSAASAAAPASALRAAVDVPAVAVVEISNETATAFAFAMVLETANAKIVANQLGVWLDGTSVLAWDRSPAVVAVGQAEVAALLQAEVPAHGWVDTVNKPAVSKTKNTRNRKTGSDVVALVWPLPHTAQLAVSAALVSGRVPKPCDLPDADAVIRGWESHLDRGARIEVPDEGLARRIIQNRRRWLGLTGRMDTADVCELTKLAVRLDHHGYHSDAELVLDEVAVRWTTQAPVEQLVAFAAHHDLTGDSNVAKRYVEAVAEAVEAAARADLAVPVQAVQRLLVAAGENTASADLMRLGLAELSGPSDGLRAELVDDHGSELLLVPGFRPKWRGGSLAAYGLPTRFGPLSYAVRWHGARPALLWELGLRPTQQMPVLRAPSLDDAWSSVAAKGEALLRAHQ
ncbi:MAG: hypothetical protein OXE93_01915 [bacterium]|nr:hypothetical protein [bacterium]